MFYTFHPTESRILDLLFYPQNYDFSIRNQNCAENTESARFEPEFLTAEFKTMESSLQEYAKQIPRFYYENFSLPQLLMKTNPPFGYKSAEEYLKMLANLEEKEILKSVILGLYKAAKGIEPEEPTAINSILLHIGLQMDLIESLDTIDEEKWKLTTLIRNPKGLLWEWLDFIHTILPVFDEYYESKKTQVETLGLQLVKELNESNGHALIALTNGMLNKTLMPSGRILVSCMEPISVQIYHTSSTPFILWGLEMAAFIQFLRESRENDLKERVAVFKNLGDKTRYEVVKLIAQGVESAKVIASILNVSQPTVSYHMNNLLLSNIILLERIDGKYIHKVNFETLEKAYLAMLNDFGKTKQLVVLAPSYN